MPRCNGDTMNIFVTTENPVRAAQWLDDLRVQKMLLESAQLLSTACRYKGATNGGLYASTHVNHPCNVWLRSCLGNFRWLIDHAIALGHIYYDIRGRNHASVDVVAEARYHFHRFDPGPRTPFANATPYPDDQVFQAYRRHLCHKWDTDIRPPTWTGRQRPTWYRVKVLQFGGGSQPS